MFTFAYSDSIRHLGSAKKSITESGVLALALNSDTVAEISVCTPLLVEGAAGGEGQDSVGESAERPQVHHQKPQLGRHTQEHTEPTGNAPLEVVGAQAP